MIEPLADANAPRVLRLISLAVLLTLFGIVGTSWGVYRTFRSASDDMSLALRIEALKGKIVSIADDLTMSVQMAAATGDDKWEARHHQLDAQQAAALKEIQTLVPDAPLRAAVARTDSADIAMTAMENSAFTFVRQGQSARAQAVLTGAEYRAQAQAYAAGMAEFSTLLSEKIAATQRNERQTLIWGVATVTLAAVLLGIGWWFVLIKARRWHTALVRGNEQLGRQAVLLEEANRDLDQKVAQRTSEVVEIAQSLRASEQNYRGLIEQSLAGIYIIQQGKFVYLNPRAVEIFGQSSVSEVIGTDPLEWIVEADRARVQEGLRQTFDGNAEHLALELSVLRRDGGTIGVGVQGSCGTYNKQPAIIGMLQDISERMRADEEIRRHVKQLEAAFMNTVEVAMNISEMRDPYTAGHERRVAELAVAIGAELGFDARRQEGLRVAGYLHDIGKIAVPAEILSKPGKLSAIEIQIIRAHAQTGYDVLKVVEFPWPVAQVARQHHERLDGSGYPLGLKGEEILLEARITAVADVVEAMSSHRPYRPGLRIETALAEIERGRGSSYDANATDACLRLFREKGFQLRQA